MCRWRVGRSPESVSSLHLRGDDVVVVHHWVDKLTHGLRQSLGLLFLLAELHGGALGGPELIVGADQDLDLAANHSVLIVLPVEEEEGGKQHQQHNHEEAGNHGRDDRRGRGDRGGHTRTRQGVRAVSPLHVVVVAGGRVLEVAAVVVPDLAEPVRTVAAVLGGPAPHAVEGRVLAQRHARTAALLGDAGGLGAEDGDGASVNVDVLDVDLVVEVQLGAVQQEGV